MQSCLKLKIKMVIKSLNWTTNKLYLIMLILKLLPRVATEMLEWHFFRGRRKKVRYDQELFAILTLGERLKKSMVEILAMTEEEFYLLDSLF
jgi:hypothetical protein